MCKLLEKDRCEVTEEKKEVRYQQARRDWEGQDNMEQFARKEEAELGSEEKEVKKEKGEECEEEYSEEEREQEEEEPKEEAPPS